MWSIPNYPSPVPVLVHNLFLAGFGLAALMRFIDSDRRRWLFAAGLCGGLSFLVKLVGIYFVAGALLFLVFQEQWIGWEARDQPPHPSRWYVIGLSTGLVAFAALLIRVFSPGLTLSRFLAILVPVISVVTILLRRELQRLPRSDWARLRTLFRLAVPLLAGAAVPVALFVAIISVEAALGAH